jgi:hypothetical protein
MLKSIYGIQQAPVLFFFFQNRGREGGVPYSTYDAGTTPPAQGLRCAERTRLRTPPHRHRTPVRTGYGPQVPARACASPHSYKSTRDHPRAPLGVREHARGVACLEIQASLEKSQGTWAALI